jgi:chromosome segregation ATPase
MQDSKGGNVDTEALRSELKETKKSMVDKEREIEDQKSRIEHLEKELGNNATVSKLQMDELETEKQGLQGKLKGERLDASAKLARKDETISKLQKELHRYQKDSEAQDFASVKEELTQVQADLETHQNEVEAAQRLINKFRGEKEDLVERNEALNEKVKVLQKNLNDVTEKSKAVGEKVLQWTEKTYEWKSRAESAEKKLEGYDENSAGGHSSDHDGVDEAPQGLFLQAVMDRKETADTKPKGRWRGLFTTGNASDSEDLSPEQIRIKGLEERNESLEESVQELRSEIVKLQTSHKGEAYSTQKKIAQLQGENDALALQNMTLQHLSRTNDDS